MKQVRFIHGADIHIDSPMIGLKSLPSNVFKRLQESTFQAFRNLVDAALFHRVDFVILAGDLFDNENRSVHAQVFLRRELERLNHEGIHVYLVHGNHDHLSGNWTQIEWPENVHVFGEKVEVMVFESRSKDTKVHLYGFSYPERHVYQRKIDEYEQLAEADFHIGILHGNLEGGEEHRNYAPFQIKDLLDKNFHYWALGHIHKRVILGDDPPIVYPGNTQGRHKKELDHKGCYLVALNDIGAELRFLETSDVVWKEVIIDASEMKTFNDLYELCEVQLDGVRMEGKGLLASLKVLNLPSEVKNSHSSLELDLIEGIQEAEKDEVSFVWPVNVDIEDKLNWKREELATDSDFYGELFEVIERIGGLEETVATLYKHQNARKFLTPLTESDMNEIMDDAEALLIESLLKSQ